MATKAWGGVTSSWADSVEEEHGSRPPAPAPLADDDDFPSLGAKNPTGPKKKVKGQKMGLSDFMSKVGSSSSAPAGRGLDPTAADKMILLNLPTAPRGRQEGDNVRPEGQLGGAFSNYGGDRGALLFPITWILEPPQPADP